MWKDYLSDARPEDAHTFSKVTKRCIKIHAHTVLFFFLLNSKFQLKRACIIKYYDVLLENSKNQHNILNLNESLDPKHTDAQSHTHAKHINKQFSAKEYQFYREK